MATRKPRKTPIEAKLEPEVVTAPATATEPPPSPSEAEAPKEPRVVRKVLTRAELDGLARWAAEAKYADAYAELRERDRKTLLARIDPKDELSPIDRALTNARAAKTKAAAKYMSIAETASRRLGVDVTQYAYDDETGLLSLTPIPK